VAHARRLLDEGARILDIGGESTRPGAAPVPADEELRRVLPVIRELAAFPEPVPVVESEFTHGFFAEPPRPPAISVDTYKAAIAAAALEAGADIVNDVSACAFDPGLRDVLVQHKPGYVLMHSLGRPEGMQRDPRYRDVVSELLAYFETNLAGLVKAGLPEDRIVIDPGIGFGKLLEHNLAILGNIGRFRELGRPVFIGLSNKSLWGRLLDLPDGRRSNATQAATAVLAWLGVAVHRVHDVAATRETLTVVEALRQARS
jgi:dihydropteroate synthase